MCKHETNLKRNQAKCQVLVAEAGEAKSSAARFGSQMATTPEIPEIAFIIQAKRHAMNDLTSMWSRNAEVSFCFLDFIFKSLKILRSFPAIESQVNSNTVLICFNPCGKLTFVFSRLLIKTWIHPAEKWANLGCRAELFTRPQEIESCLETPRHCSGDCTHLAICTCLRRHGVYTAAEAAEASIAVFLTNRCFVKFVLPKNFWWIVLTKIWRRIQWSSVAVARFHTTSRRLSRRRAIRTWLLSTIADTHPTYLIWRILMDSVHFCPYILHNESVFTMVSPVFTPFWSSGGAGGTFGSVWLKFRGMLSMFSFCISSRSFGLPKMMLHQLRNGSISPGKDTIGVLRLLV